jgi:hypothetical protein
MAKKRESRIKAEIIEELQGIDDAVEMPDPNPVSKDPLPDLAAEETASIADNTTSVIDMTKVKEGNEHEIITTSIRKEFNPNATQNALEDSDNEGGVYRYRSTGGGASSEGGIYRGSSKAQEGDVEISGFKILVDLGEGDQSIDVIARFVDINTAKASINGDSFIFVVDGVMRVGTIISGAPVISNDEQEIAKYVNGEWSRA